MSTSVLEALPGKLDIKRHSPSILNISVSCWDASVSLTFIQPISIAQVKPLINMHITHTPNDKLLHDAAQMKNTSIKTSLKHNKTWYFMLIGC